jgi:hypothetical protein
MWLQWNSRPLSQRDDVWSPDWKLAPMGAHDYPDVSDHDVGAAVLPLPLLHTPPQDGVTPGVPCLSPDTRSRRQKTPLGHACLPRSVSTVDRSLTFLGRFAQFATDRS